MCYVSLFIINELYHNHSWFFYILLINICLRDDNSLTMVPFFDSILIFITLNAAPRLPTAIVGGASATPPQDAQPQFHSYTLKVTAGQAVPYNFRRHLLLGLPIQEVTSREWILSTSIQISGAAAAGARSLRQCMNDQVNC
jgi:hypothetical protein